MYAVVSVDGTLTNLVVIKSAGREFDSATLAVLPLWRYQPATFGAKAIPTEEVIGVNYVLGY